MQHIMITIEGDGVKYLHRELQASHHREDIFKQAMMKAQSQADVMRRFIQERLLDEQFAAFVIQFRTNDNPTNVLGEFGFADQDEQKKDQATTDTADSPFDFYELPKWAQINTDVAMLCRQDVGFRHKVCNARSQETRETLIREANSLITDQLRHEP